jgi:hypothetical protein
MNRGCNNAASLRKQLAGLQQVERLLQTGITRGSALGPGNAGWQRELAVSYSRLAYASKKAGDKSEALEALRQGQAIMVRMTSLSPDNAPWKRDLAWIDRQIAELAP